MANKPLLDRLSFVTRSRQAIVQMLKALDVPVDPLPEVVDLGPIKFVLSDKRDVFYTVSAQECSCPSFAYHGWPCKHQEKHFQVHRGMTIAEVLEEHDKNLPRMPRSYRRMVRAAREEAADEDPDSIMPKCKWPGGYNGPVDPDIIKAESTRKEA